MTREPRRWTIQVCPECGSFGRWVSSRGHPYENPTPERLAHVGSICNGTPERVEVVEAERVEVVEARGP